MKLVFTVCLWLLEVKCISGSGDHRNAVIVDVSCNSCNRRCQYKNSKQNRQYMVKSNITIFISAIKHSFRHICPFAFIPWRLGSSLFARNVLHGCCLGSVSSPHAKAQRLKAFKHSLALRYVTRYVSFGRLLMEAHGRPFVAGMSNVVYLIASNCFELDFMTARIHSITKCCRLWKKGETVYSKSAVNDWGSNPMNGPSGWFLLLH